MLERKCTAATKRRHTWIKLGNILYLVQTYYRKPFSGYKNIQPNQI